MKKMLRTVSLFFCDVIAFLRILFMSKEKRRYYRDKEKSRKNQKTKLIAARVIKEEL